MTPKTVKEWPYEIRLVAIKDLVVDSSYQRPVEPEFVARMANAFEPRAVGTLIGAARAGSKVAIIEGQQRYEVLKKVGAANVWVCVNKGMTVADEAEMFFRINKDRKSVHPFYNLRARKVAGDKVAKSIFAIVEESEFKLGVSPSSKQINAIAAVEQVYRLSTIKRDDCLTPVLATITKSFKGSSKATDGHLIRGLGILFQSYGDDDMDAKLLYEVLSLHGAPFWVNEAKAEDRGNKTSTSRGHTVAKLVVRFYNNEAKSQGIRTLNPKFLMNRAAANA